MTSKSTYIGLWNLPDTATATHRWVVVDKKTANDREVWFCTEYGCNRHGQHHDLPDDWLVVILPTADATTIERR